LIRIWDKDKSGTENACPVIIPLKSKFPKDLMADSDSVNYELLGDFISPGTDDKGHCITYIKNKEDLLRFQGDKDKQPINNAGDGAKIEFESGT
jgi:hypothetical protein